MSKKSIELSNNIRLKNKYINKDKERKFRLCAKNMLLTFSPCSMKICSVLAQIKLKLYNTSYNLEKYLIVSETGQKQHVHVLLQFDKKIDIRNERFFDLQKEGLFDKDNNSILHGNYISCKKPKDAIVYLLKNTTNKNPENILFSDNLNNLIHENGKYLPLDGAMLHLAEQGKIADALELLRVEDIKRYVKDRFSLENTLRKHYAVKLGFQTKFSFEDFHIPECLNRVLQSKDIKDGLKSLFMVGLPGTGKTQMMLSLLRRQNRTPLIVNNFDGLRFFSESNDCIIIDDANWSEVANRETLIKIIDSQDKSTLSIKHGSVSIPSNTQRFIISNKLIEEYLNLSKIPLCAAVTRRYVLYKLPEGVSLFANKIESYVESSLLDAKTN